VGSGRTIAPVFRSEACLALTVLFLLAGPADMPLTEGFPPALPGRLTLAGWEQVRGEVRDANGRVDYRFYVDPARRALYRITQYRIVPARGPAETEKLLWNETPGRARLQCYERVSERDWETLWLWERWRWRQLEPDSARYRNEMMTAAGIYRLHQARLESSQP
jgi:hypothetical protein